MRKPKFRMSLRGIFSVIVTAEILLAVGLSWLATWILEWILDRPVTTDMPQIGFVFLIAFCVTAGMSMFVNQRLLEPIRRLSRAMSRVAGGEYSVELQGKSLIREVNESYESFNLMTRELRATQILKSDFISAVSHELKTPISAIEGYAMLLEDPDLTGEEREEYAGKLMLNTHRLSDLVSNMLLLSRLDSEAIDTGSVSFRLDEQIRQCILQHQQLWTAKEIEWDVELEEVTYCGNQALLMHVWSNLISNAIKFSPQGGCIRMTLSRDCVFHIQDEGAGVKPSDRAHIFDRFFQGDSSRKQEGHGLGLALVRQILDFTGGSVRLLESPKGALFEVVLPQK